MVLKVDRKKRQIRLSMKAIQPEIVEEVKPERESKRGRKNKKSEKEEETQIEENLEPELTAMQMAWQSAQDRAKSHKSQKSKRIKSSTIEQEDILSRTLEKRLPTGA
jgi:ribosomal protein S1